MFYVHEFAELKGAGFTAADIAAEFDVSKSTVYDYLRYKGEPRLRTSGAPPGGFGCPYCERTFLTLPRRNNHMGNVHAKRWWEDISAALVESSRAEVAKKFGISISAIHKKFGAAGPPARPTREDLAARVSGARIHEAAKTPEGENPISELTSPCPYCGSAHPEAEVKNLGEEILDAAIAFKTRAIKAEGEVDALEHEVVRLKREVAHLTESSAKVKDENLRLRARSALATSGEGGL